MNNWIYDLGRAMISGLCGVVCGWNGKADKDKRRDGIQNGESVGGS